MTATASMTGAQTPPRETQLIDVRGLRIMSRVSGRTNEIVTGIDVAVARGETVGIVGESGSGKSMTARALAGLLPRGVWAEGSVVYGGDEILGLSERDVARFRGSEICLIPQDPFVALNPLMRCGDQITEMVRRDDGGRLTRDARRDEAVRRLAEVGIGDAGVADRFPFQLSGGMRQRVAIAAALARNPNLVIADEPSTALDVTTQRDVLALLKTLQRSRQMGLVLITHDLRVAFAMCDRIYVLYAGSVLEVGGAAEVEREPLHPYTLGLLLSDPPADRRLGELVAIAGTVPAPDEVRDMCAFAPRCGWAEAGCRAGKPALAALAADRLSACIRVPAIRDDMARARGRVERAATIAGPPSTTDALIRVDAVTKWFVATSGRLKGARVEALKNVTIEVGAAESVGLVGESGSGKTTLARCLVGLETPTAGQITIGGTAASDYSSISGSERRKLRQTIQIIFQDPYSSLNPVRSVGATLREALSVGRFGSRLPQPAVRELLQRVGLPPTYAERKPAALSGGERQRVAIARALAVRPQVIVCDEPVSSLDVSVQAQILNLFRDLQSELGLSLLFITHDLAVVRQIVERVYVLYRGEVVESGLVDDVLTNPRHPYTRRLVESVPRAEPEWLQVDRAGALAASGPR